MLLIEAVEVSYFRSIYKDTLNKLKPTTVLFGKNDAGKSNFLRALNLFFQDETNPRKKFDFNLDFSNSRKREATEATDARKFVYVKVFFKTPSSWKRSLGERFYVKKTWAPSSGVNYKYEYSSHIKPNNIKFITRLLNSIEYHYVPAVKDRDIFSQLLLKVYSILSEDAQFQESLESFSEEIKSRTLTLSQGLKDSIALSSSIAPPADLSSLFSALDFTTIDDVSGEDFSLILQRGDGIQARHIPELLRFISDHSSKSFHIWGLEEPENSLELHAAQTESKRIIEHSKTNNIQIFVTSHSPAFFNAKSDECTKFFISKDFDDYGNYSEATDISKNIPLDNHKLMGDSYYIREISDTVRTLEEQLNEYDKNLDSLNEQLATQERPILFVEGPTDEIIITAAWEALDFPSEMPFDMHCKSVSYLSPLASPGDAISTLAPNRQIFVLIDYDGAGRKAVKKFSKLKPDNSWHSANNNIFWAFLYPTDEAETAYKKMGIPKNHWPIIIENCFSSQLRRNALDEGAYNAKKIPFPDIRDNYNVKSFSLLDEFPDNSHDEWFYLCQPSNEDKEAFSDWIASKVQTDSEIFEHFRPLLQGIIDTLEEETE